MRDIVTQRIIKIGQVNNMEDWEDITDWLIEREDSIIGLDDKGE